MTYEYNIYSNIAHLNTYSEIPYFNILLNQITLLQFRVFFITFALIWNYILSHRHDKYLTDF